MKKQALITKISAGILALGLAGTANAVPISGQGTWETTLQGRDLDGNTAPLKLITTPQTCPKCTLLVP